MKLMVLVSQLLVFFCWFFFFFFFFLGGGLLLFVCLFVFVGFFSVFVFCFPGRGVIATRPFQKGDFLLEYRGQLLTSPPDAKDNDGTYVYQFRVKENNYWLVSYFNILCDNGYSTNNSGDRYNSRNLCAQWCILPKTLFTSDSNERIFRTCNIFSNCVYIDSNPV